MIDGLIRFCLDKAMTSYYAAMEEQVSIIVSIITALLTGGFIILFLDNQHVGATVIERYHFVMQPFMHRLSNYFKFLSSAKTYFSITKGTKKDEAEYVFKFHDLMDKLGHYAYPCIMSGQDYPASKFTAKQLENICNDINNVWYYWDRKQNYMIDYCSYDTRKAEQLCKLGRECLKEVFPLKYNKQVFSLSLISDVSGTFFAEIYQPIQHVPYEYEYWCKQEKYFQKTTYSIIGLCLFTLLIILLLRYFVPLWVMNYLDKNKYMRILHIAECAGGVERYLQMLLPRLEKKGIKQYFICSRNYDESLYSKIVDGVQQMDLTQSFSPLRVIKKVRAIRREIKKVNPDILYCHSSFAGGLGRMAAIGLHCKVVYNPHGWAFNIK